MRQNFLTPVTGNLKKKTQYLFVIEFCLMSGPRGGFFSRSDLRILLRAWKPKCKRYKKLNNKTYNN